MWKDPPAFQANVTCKHHVTNVKPSLLITSEQCQGFKFSLIALDVSSWATRATPGRRRLYVGHARTLPELQQKAHARGMGVKCNDRSTDHRTVGGEFSAQDSRNPGKEDSATPPGVFGHDS